jgi:hypothetical protein
MGKGMARASRPISVAKRGIPEHPRIHGLRNFRGFPTLSAPSFANPTTICALVMGAPGQIFAAAKVRNSHSSGVSLMLMETVRFGIWAWSARQSLFGKKIKGCRTSRECYTSRELREGGQSESGDSCERPGPQWNLHILRRNGFED